MLPWHVRFRVGNVEVESVDSVRYQAALAFARSVATPERTWPQLEKLQQVGVEIDPEALIAELDALAKLSPPPGVPGVLGSLRDDALRALAIARGRG